MVTWQSVSPQASSVLMTPKRQKRGKQNERLLHCPKWVYRIYRKAGWDSLRHDLAQFSKEYVQSDHLSRTVDENWAMLKSAMQQAVNKHIPQKKLSGRCNLPWLSTDIKRDIRRKQRAFNKVKNKERDWGHYRAIRKHIKRQLAIAHDSYIKDLLEIQPQEKPKRFWSYIKSKKKDSTGVSALKLPDGTTISDSKSKAGLPSDQFHSVFTKEDLGCIPDLGISDIPSMQSIVITTQGVAKLLRGLNTSKAPGPDLLSPKVLREAADEIAPVLACIFHQSLRSGDLPRDWLVANITAVFKKGRHSLAENYRPVSLTAICCKVMEHIIYRQIMGHLDANNILVHYQHGFRQKHSCESQSINNFISTG